MSSRKTSRRKAPRRKAKSGNANSITGNLLGGFSDRARVTLRYVTNVTMTPAGVAASSYVFRGNGCFDPDVTSTGLQPANWDDWSAQYARYRVHGSKLTWNISNNATGTLDMSSYVVGPRHQSTALTTRSAQENFQSQPYTRFDRSIIYRNGVVKGSMTMTSRKFFGLTQVEFDGNDDATALVSADPTHQWFWQMCLTSDDQSSTIPHYVNFTIDYDVEFWDRVDTSLDLKYARIVSIREAKRKYDLDSHKSCLEDEDLLIVPDVKQPGCPSHITTPVRASGGRDVAPEGRALPDPSHTPRRWMDGRKPP